MADIQTLLQTQFENPPVVEVACGVIFNNLENLLVPHFGLLWEEFKAEYPLCQEEFELEPTIENIPSYPEMIGEEFSDIPSLPRILFLSSEKDRIIQIQRNRFLYNWRKVKSSDEYPRFETVIKIFHQHLSTFSEFLRRERLGEIRPLQYEIVYVNIISTDIEEFKLTEIGRIFPDISWRNNQERFLAEPESINWRSTFLLPENAGRIYVTTGNIKPNNDRDQKFLMNITMRGIGHERESLEGLSDWFNFSHDWIIQSFIDLTSSEMQNVWRKKDGN